MIWNPEYEQMDRTQLAELQLRRLRSTVAWAYERVPYYRAQLDERGVKPKSIHSLDTLRDLPFTDKDALRDTYPFGMFAVPMEQVVRLHSSSGTTGKPVVVGYTARDVADWAESMAGILAGAGVNSSDVIQNAFSYGLLTGGMGYQLGAERLGVTVVP